MLQGLVGHDRPQIGTADSYVDHVPNSLAGVTLPVAAPQPVGEVRHPVEHGMHLGHDVLSIHDDGLASRCAQGNVQDRAFFCDVDFVATKHGIDPFMHTGFLGQSDQQLDGFAGNAILRVVEKKAQSLDAQVLAALGIVCKELPHVLVPDLLIVSCRGPSRPGG